ncbi:MAG: PIG-L deacetylase family protein [Microbacterium sp.]
MTPEFERALVVAAHPDDADVNSGGTIAKWATAGVNVTLLVLTDGAAGGDEAMTPEELVVARQREQRRAGAAVGITDIRFLQGYPDGALAVSPELVEEIVRVIRQVRPHRVVMLSPERNWNNIAQGHTDHLVAGEATIRAVYPAARNPFSFPRLRREEHLEPWTVGEVWVQDPPTPNHAEDVTDFFEQKLAAISAHASQFHGSFDIEARLRERMAKDAARFGLPAGRLAEPYRIVQAG